MPDLESSRPIVVAGNGMVGHHLCARLVESGATRERRVVVFAEEARAAYDRIHLVELLTGRSADSLTLAPESWYAEHGIELRLGDPVVSIDRERMCVRSAAGLELSYETLVLATGSRPSCPPIEGIDLDIVSVYRTTEDVEAIDRRAHGARDAVVVGGGLLGLEAARALVDRGLRVTVVEAAVGLLCRQLDPVASQALRHRIERLGVDVRLGRPPRRIEKRGARGRVVFADGSDLEGDLVVVATGILPRDELAARAGLAIAARGGVLVDDRLRTSDRAILAIGECAAHRGRVYGLAGPGYRMAEVVAENLRGGDERFDGGEFSTTLKVFGAEVSVLGENLASGNWLEHRDGDVLRQVVIRGGRLVGATIVGDGVEAPRLQAAIDRSALVWPWQVRRFRRTGSLWDEATDEPVGDWPAARVVCRCTGVTRGALGAAIRAGAHDCATLSRSTGAAGVCGSCRPLLGELLGGGTAAPATTGGWLGRASIVAILAAFLVAAAGPVPLSSRVESGPHLDVLWRSGLARQGSGYALLALGVLAGAIVVRRRTRLADRFGAFASWRAVHAAIGLVALVLLAVHTGLRLGENFNRILALSFLGASFAGGLAGSSAAGALRLRPAAAQRWQRGLAALHAILTWPLPVLVVLHVITVYYF